MKLKRTLRKAYALATVMVLMGVAMFGVGALVTITGLEAKISRSQQEGIHAYYVAEAGMADALWQLQNTSSYRNALAGGTLNASYTVNNFPQTGQSYTVTMVTNAQGAGYGTVTVNATWDNGTFVAKRRVEGTVFSGSAASVGGTGGNAVLAGGTLSINQGGAVNVSNGDFATAGNINLVQSTFNIAPYWIRAGGNYNNNSSTVNAGGISASNVPPTSTIFSVPGVNFPAYQAAATTTYTGTQFANLIRNNTNVNLPGPITYVSSSVTLNANHRNRNVTVNGILVINGSFNVSNSASNFVMNVNDPGTGVSGVLASQNLTIASGTCNVNGVLYAGQNLSLSPASMSINGAIVSGQTTSISAGSTNINHVSSRTTAIFGAGTSAQPFQVLHWEEEY